MLLFWSMLGSIVSCEPIVNVCVIRMYVMRPCERSSSSRVDVSVAVILSHNLDFCFASEEMKWQKWWDAKNWIKIYLYGIGIWNPFWFVVKPMEYTRDMRIVGWAWVSVYELNFVKGIHLYRIKIIARKNKLSIGILKFCTVIDSNENWQFSKCVRARYACISVTVILWERGGDNQIFVAKPLLLFC